MIGLSLLIAFFGCQVDRQAIRITLADCRCLYSFLRKLFFGLFFLTALLAQGEKEILYKPSGLIWEVSLESEEHYVNAVSNLINAYETEVGSQLTPGIRGKVGIKVNTRSGRGLSTPLGLLRAVIQAFEDRGFERKSILIVGYSAHGLREAGIISFFNNEWVTFEGCPVYALDSEQYYDNEWFYDSPLPPSRNQRPQLLESAGDGNTPLSEGVKERKSFLPVPLLFEVDFWLNLVVAADGKALGIDGALASATLWNVSNSQRFLSSEATAAVAVAEIAAIPELSKGMLLHFVSLKRYQYIGGPQFNSFYTHSEPLLWMSADPVAIDRLMFERINALRRNNGFPEIEPLPRQLPFAASLGLGVFEEDAIQIRKIDP